MKKLVLKATGVALSLLTLLNSALLPSAALYRGVLGDVYSAHSRQIGAGVDFTLYRAVTDGLNERAYVFEYRPGEGALPIVSWGDSLMGSNRVSSLANHEIEAGNNVIGGINGDFYSVYTGIPMGAVIRDGRIISDDDKNNAVGFTYDGETLFGSPGIIFSVIHTYEKPADDTAAASAKVECAETENVTETVNETVTETVTEPEETLPDDTVDPDTTDEISAAAEPSADETAETADEASDTEEVLDDETATDEEKELDSDNTDDGIEYIREELPVSYFNKYPTEWGAYLVDDVFADSTRSTKPSLEIVIKLDSPDMYARAGETLTGTVSAVHNNASDTPIEPGTMVISVCETSAYRGNYLNVAVGNKMEITFDVAEGWENVSTAIGGSDLIVKDGKVNTDAIDEYHEKVANPRTAVGVRADGTVIFFAVDGRSDDSYGMRMVSLAETLRSFGCVQAMNLDGGGSTTAIVKYPGDSSPTLANTPSDSAERAVSNALLLIGKSEPDGIPRYIIPTVTDPVILPGESYSFEGDIYDESLTIIELSEADTEDSKFTSLPEVKLSFDESRLSYYDETTLPDLGTISEDGLTYTANGITGEIPLLFTAEYGEETLTGRVILFVANAPDTVEIALGSAVYTSDEGFPVEFDAYYMGKPVPAKPEHLTFALNDYEVRSAHAASEEDDEIKLADCSIGRITEDGMFVPYPDADGSAWLTIALDGIPMSQTLIVYKSPYVTALTEKEIIYSFPAVESVITESADTEETSDVTDMPAETAGPNDGAVSESVIFESDLPIENALSLDLYASDSDLELYASVFDYDGNEHKISYKKQINEPDNNGVYHYRAALNGEYSALSAILGIDADTNAGRSGRITVTKAEISYNDTETVFYDTYDHWARTSINKLYRDGIVGGEEYDGRMRFAPDRSLSRAEFAVMISRSLGYDISEYTVDPAFDDLASVPAWALPYVRAVSANKIMNGKDMPDGTLCFDSSGNITRQEIMQVMGNIIKLEEQKSIIEAIEEEVVMTETEAVDDIVPEDTVSDSDAENDTAAEDDNSELPIDENELDDMTAVLFDDLDVSDSGYVMPAFTDASEIAAWAYENVLLTLQAGIITGYEDNTLRPTRNVTRAEAAAVILRSQNYLEINAG